MLPKGSIYLLINSLGGGGAERLNIDLAQRWDVPIITLEKTKQYTTKNLKIKPLIGFKGGQFIQYIQIFWYAFQLSFKVKKNDIIVSSLIRSNIVAACCKVFFKKIKVVTWYHNSIKDYPKKFAWLYRFAYQNSDSIIVNSKQAKDDLIQIFKIKPTKIEVLYNAFNIQDIQKKSLQEQALPDYFKQPTLINIGRLTLQKSQQRLLFVFKDILKEIPTAQLIFLGQGELLKELQKAARTLKIENNVHFLGFQQNPYAFLKAANLMILSSDWEGFGNVIVETLAVGTPVISVDIDNGPREILAPNTPYSKRTNIVEKSEFGLLLPHQNTSLWKAAIVNLLKNTTLQNDYKRKGLERVKAFDQSVIIPQFEQILERL